jgi:hypothetical protein
LRTEIEDEYLARHEGGRVEKEKLRFLDRIPPLNRLFVAGPVLTRLLSGNIYSQGYAEAEFLTELTE